MNEASIHADTSDRSVRPGILYHYTDAVGLYGIVMTQKLWATHPSFLNDAKEGLHALELARRLLETRSNATVEEREGLERYMETYQGDPLSETVNKETRFVTSFSELGDDLSQWRAYGADGYGYCLGFDLSAYYEFRFQHHGPVKVRSGPVTRVAYDRGEQERVLLSGDPWRTQNFAVKHPAFRAEREWRLLVPVIPRGFGDDRQGAGAKVSTDVRIRPSERGLIPYVEFSPDNGPRYGESFIRDKPERFKLSQVICGPAVSSSAQLGSVRLLVEQAGYDNVDVVPSSAPYLP